MAQANASFDEISASTRRYYANGKFAQQVYSGRRFLKWLQGNGRIQTWDGGDPIVEPILHEENTTVQSQTDFAELNYSPQGGLGAAHFTAKLYTGTAVLDWVSIWKNSGRAKVIDLWDAKVEQLKESFATRLNRDAITGDPTVVPTNLTGIKLIVDSAGTLGNIARSTNTFWQSYEEGTAGPLDAVDMRTAINTAGRALPDEKIDLILTTQILYEAYQQQILPAYQVQNLNNADLGATTAYFMGIPIVWDPEVPPGEMYFLSSKHLKWRPHVDANIELSDKDLVGKQLVNGLFTYFYGALTTDGPRYMAKLTGRTA